MWNSFSDFLAMGGYGLYVWGSLGACALVCIFEPISLNLKRRALLAEMHEVGVQDTGQ
ncbi:MAG: heme exporter protein CcmD [Polaromonas sp.]|nr:heme exporter protein CcmD [Polaromonas sp.]